MPQRTILRLINPDGTSTNHEVLLRHEGDYSCYSAPCSPGLPTSSSSVQFLVRSQEAPELRNLPSQLSSTSRPKIISVVWLKLTKWSQGFMRNKTCSPETTPHTHRHIYTHHPIRSFSKSRFALAHLTPSRPDLLNHTLHPTNNPSLSCMEMIGWSQPFSRGLNTVTQEDGSRHVRWYYDDDLSRAQVKNLVQTTQFDDLLLAGFETIPGESRCSTIHVTLTPENARRLDIC